MKAILLRFVFVVLMKSLKASSILSSGLILRAQVSSNILNCFVEDNTGLVDPTTCAGARFCIEDMLNVEICLREEVVGISSSYLHAVAESHRS